MINWLSNIFKSDAWVEDEDYFTWVAPHGVQYEEPLEEPVKAICKLIRGDYTRFKENPAEVFGQFHTTLTDTLTGEVLHDGRITSSWLSPAEFDYLLSTYHNMKGKTDEIERTQERERVKGVYGCD